jgi:hypothetical protein
MQILVSKTKKKKTISLAFSLQANYMDRSIAGAGVMPTFAGRGCCVVSATDSYVC